MGKKEIVKSKQRKRTDENGIAYKLSQLQIQYLINCRKSNLGKKLEEKGIKGRIKWVSPIPKDNFKEYGGQNFLKQLRLDYLKDELKKFWPSRSPQWDALGLLKGGEEGYILVEAKSHIGEINKRGTSSTNEANKDKIRESILNTRKRLLNSKDNYKENWKKEYYQIINRICFQNFLKENIKKHSPKKVYLLFIYFINDPEKEASQEQWKYKLKEIKDILGIKENHIENCHDIFIDAVETNAARCCLKNLVKKKKE
ncbi:MAG: hypothetical protein K9L87_04900 [Candidatus Omnitrophica bacterium]|nr:hypothetical protein [Candidatus Omnitrophota bacterium]MCF7892383.1 hypothetical protein [Candidatus Omnitrophota bacterium]MCF7895952.1 hypothetical protein [Candidatus Omnitrophota bacterium]MCF7898065.1 hypothetical protein [Candidatus Omnitrophota bacterium]MCF7909917.1 hypothetical protein [Candidatus Omnitrophota bacterium]